MSNSPDKSKALTPQKKESIFNKIVSPVKDVTEYLSDFTDSVKDVSGLSELVNNVSPYTEALTTSLAEGLPVIKGVVKGLEKLTEQTDPEILGHIACTAAYISSIQHAIKSHTATEQKTLSKLASKNLRTIEPNETIDFRTFSFRNALGHPFVITSNKVFLEFAAIAGYSESERTELLNSIHDIFVSELKKMLADKETKDKFDPFFRFIELGTEEREAYIALGELAKYQKWLFEEAPTFNREPFALKHVYIDTECSKLTWGEIRKEKDRTRGHSYENNVEPIDPFSEKSGGRHNLLETVLEYFASKDFRDLIVIQGLAGAGKSSFTIRLSAKLVELGLCPIRIRLRDLRLDKHISESLPEAAMRRDERYSGFEKITKPRDLFLDGSIFNESIEFKWEDSKAKICRYVLILDGWDEISISASEGLQTRINRVLEQVKNEFLGNKYSAPVRVIITGRPSETIKESGMLKDKTPILTIKHIRPEQVKDFVSILAKVSKEKPIAVEQEIQWKELNVNLFEGVFKKYEEDFNQELSHSSLAVLGSPLLLYLSIRVLSFRQNNLIEVLQNPTTLYRLLIDLTVSNAGKADFDERVDGAGHIFGEDLRKWLRKTATAMSICGSDSISRQELQKRLKLDANQLEKKVSRAEQDNILTKLMISFYFKGGHFDSGCEFSHKSFREYLFAEQIIETLKDYGRRQKIDLPEREPYWKDFDQTIPNDYRYKFSRELSELLAPQWLSPEVVGHIEQLIAWEIFRSANETSIDKEVGSPTQALDLQGWCRVRDALADIWGWWVDSVHLRPRTVISEDSQLEIKEPYVISLIRLAAPLDRSADNIPILSDTTTMDAHLGDGIFRLCALAHFQIAENIGWKGYSFSLDSIYSVRHFQITGTADKKSVLFWPEPILRFENIIFSGFENIINRINSTRNRPLEKFPSFVSMAGIYLGTVSLKGANLFMSNLCKANFIYAHLEGATLQGTNFEEANLQSAHFYGADFDGANFERANLEEADLRCTFLRNVNFSNANVDNTDFRKAKLDDKQLVIVYEKGAILDDEQLKRVRVFLAQESKKPDF